MRIRHLFRIINWSAAGIAVGVIIIGKEQYYPWIVVVVLAAVSLHSLVETAALFRRRRFLRRLADTREFSGHQALAVRDVEEALAAGPEVAGVALAVALTGTLSAVQEKKAPLSGKKAAAWRVVAEPLEGVGKVGGQVLTVDAWWPDLTVSDETGSVPLRGPGVLDGSSYVERVYSVSSLKSELPDLASRVCDGLGITDGESRKLRVALREVALLSRDRVTVYGNAQRSSDGLSISGTDVLDDPGSLMVRAAVRPASSRIPRRLAATVALSAVSLALLVGLAAFVSSTVASSLFAPGGLFDASRTGAVKLDLDGRLLRVSIGERHWDIDAGATTRDYALRAGSGSFAARRSSTVLVQEVHPSVVSLKPGDAGYPRWDGAAWVFEASLAGSAAPGAAAPGPAHSGPLYIRNLTESAVTLRVLTADNRPQVDTSWSFTPHEAADDPKGHYLDVQGHGTLAVPSVARLELTTARGYLRILPLASVGQWDAPSSVWRFEIVPEYLAGRGNLYVKNSGDQPLKIWLIGADGQALFGDDPWTFEPQEGSKENRGLRLQLNEKNISITGREVIKVEREGLSTLYQGPLERLGTWKNGAWTVDVSRAVRGR